MVSTHVSSVEVTTAALLTMAHWNSLANSSVKTEVASSLFRRSRMPRTLRRAIDLGVGMVVDDMVVLGAQQVVGQVDEELLAPTCVSLKAESLHKGRAAFGKSGTT